MSLREIVNPRIDGGDLRAGSGACSPDFRFQKARLRRRWLNLARHGCCFCFTHTQQQRATPNWLRKRVNEGLARVFKH